MSESIRKLPGESVRGGARPAVAVERIAVLAGLPHAQMPLRLAQKAASIVPADSILCVDTMQDLRDAASRQDPEVIVLDDRILGRGALAESLAQLVSAAPVILIAPYERHAEIGELVSAGTADFVPRAADWDSLAASLLERRLRCGHGGTSALSHGSRWEDMGEIFRHEINNPLTGILGNAELLLAHSDNIPATETQRIRTMVELAVRLRETVRRVSNTWAKQ